METSTDLPSSRIALTWLSRVPLILMLLLFVGLDLSIATVFVINNDEMAGLVIGVIFAQILVCAVVTALGPWPLFARVIGGTLATGFVCLAMLICAVRDAGNDGLAFALVGAMVVQWLLYQAPLWMARRQGWQLQWTGVASRVSSVGETQFGIRQLLIWTGIVAVFMGAARAVMGGEVSELGSQFDANAKFFVCITLFNSLLVFPFIWGAFVTRYWVIWLVGGLCWCVALSSLEILCIRLWITPIDSEIFLFLNLSQSIFAAASLLTVRIADVRLTRVSENA